MALRQKIEAEIEASVLARANELAAAEGKGLSDVVEEALTLWNERQTYARANPRVVELHEASIRQYRAVYEHLAK